MSLTVMTSGDDKCLTSVTSAETLTVHLYTNSYSPTKSDTTSAYTECTIAGYAAANLTGANWSIANGTASYSSPAIFNFTAGGTVYGYYVVGATSGVLYWAEEFTTPATLPSGGGSITLTPTITFS